MNEKHFIIDTNKYSGNFEREMIAFITGVETGRGEKYSEIAQKELDANTLEWFEDNIVEKHYDTHLELCSIYPNPRYVNDGLGNHFEKDYWFDPDNKQEIILLIEEDLKERFKQEIINLDEIKFDEEITTESQKVMDSKEMHKDEYKDRLVKCREEAEDQYESPYPAYLSVIFQFYEDPSKEIVTIIKERAKKFCEIYREESNENYLDFKFEGLRLETTITQVEYHNL